MGGTRDAVPYPEMLSPIHVQQIHHARGDDREGEQVKADHGVSVGHCLARCLTCILEFGDQERLWIKLYRAGGEFEWWPWLYDLLSHARPINALDRGDHSIAAPIPGRAKLLPEPLRGDTQGQR